MSVGQAIFWKLTNTAEIAALLGTRVYPHKPDPVTQPVYPLIVYQPEGEQLLGAGCTTYSQVVNVACLANSEETAKSLATLARDSLHKQKGSWGGVSVVACFYQDGSESVDKLPIGDLWVVEQSFNFWINR